MAAGNFIKDNLALVAGIAVPVVLVVGFLLTSSLGKMLTPAPAYTAYFVLQNNDGGKQDSSIDVKVGSDGKIIATVTPVKEEKNGYRPNAQRDTIVTYNAATDTLTEYQITPPADMTTGDFTPEAFKDAHLSTQAQAQDGYIVGYGRRGNYNLAADIFMARGAEGYRISKNSAVYRLPDRGINGYSSPYYYGYYNLRFLGWGTEKQQ